MRRRKGFEATPPHTPRPDVATMGPSTTFSHSKLGTSGQLPIDVQASGPHSSELPQSKTTHESTSGEDTEETMPTGSSRPGSRRWKHATLTQSVQTLFRPVSKTRGDLSDEGAGGKSAGTSTHLSPEVGGGAGKAAQKYDPEEYQHAKKQLKRAMLECYR